MSAVLSRVATIIQRWRRCGTPNSEKSTISEETSAEKTSEPEAHDTADASGASKSVSEAKQDGESEEPKRLDIWRQNREGKFTRHPDRRKPSDNKSGGHQRSDKKTGGRPKNQNFKKSGGKPNKPKREVEKPIDPDSPFAALLALKDDMKDKK